MLIAISKYTKSLSEVDVYRPNHRKYLKTLFETGKLFIAGRKSPPSGGVIIAKTQLREEFEKLLNNDPFVKAGVAEYTIIEFTPTLYNDCFLELLNK